MFTIYYMCLSFYQCFFIDLLADIAMSESLGIADSLYNLQQVIDFCENKLPSKVLHLTMNDLFYTSEVIKPHLLSFFADLFYHFELDRATCVQDISKHMTVNNGTIGDNEGKTLVGL